MSSCTQSEMSARTQPRKPENISTKSSGNEATAKTT